MKRIYLIIISICFLLLFSLSVSASSYNLFFETDQYSTMLVNIEDSTHEIDLIVNNVISTTAKFWEGPRNDFKFAKIVANTLDDIQFEYWINNTRLIDKIKPVDGVYSNLSIFNSPAIYLKGITSTMSLNNVQIGADKVTHFFGVGIIYYEISEIKNSSLDPRQREKKAIDYGIRTEKTYWGKITSNIFSNADLVANYEGFLFYLSLFRDNVIGDRKAIIKWQGDTPRVRRAFTFKDHVNDFWNEALNPSVFGKSLDIKVKKILESYCETNDYQNNSDKLKSKFENELKEKYTFLGLDFNFDYTLRQICFEVSKIKKVSEVSSNSESETYNKKSYKKNSFSFSKSSIPTCGYKIGRAKSEFNQISLWDEMVLKIYKEPLLNYFFNFHFNDFLGYNEKLLTEIGVSNSLILKEYKENSVYLILHSIFIDKNWGIELQIDSNFDNENIKTCIGLPVVFKETEKTFMINREFRSRKNVKPYIKTCVEKNIYTGEILNYDIYRIDFDKKTFYSIEDFMDFDNKEAYVFRTTPKYCKQF